MPVTVPPRLAEHAADPAWAEWLDRLPRLVDEVAREWSLVPDGDTATGGGALVLPVRTGSGEPAALKVGRPRRASETEHLALRYWDGDGAVRLLRADPRRSVLLLERADASRTLAALPHDDAIEVIAALVPRLQVAPPPQVRTLSSLVAEWVERLPRLAHDARVPRRLTEHALGLAGDLADAPGTAGALLHTDLRSDQVLGSLRGDDAWLAIGAKPLAGDPSFEAAPLLAERWHELPPDRIRDGLLGRLWVLTQATGWDEDRVRAWALLRQVASLQDAADDGTLSTERLDRGIQFAKAMEK